jgi:N-acetylmuramoyl-L-alanine amidase
MDKIILKWVTALTGGLTVVVCITMMLLPKLHKDAVLAAETDQEEASVTEEEELPPEAAVSVEPVVVSTPEEIVETDESMPAQLRIELPEGVTQEELVIENSYLTQTVYIRIPCESRDYFSDYQVKGSCEHISAISYYRDSDGQEGVIALSLDRVYELDETYEDGSLYLDFINPQEIYDRVVVIDAGHGGKASGEVKNQIEEKNINLGIVLALKELLDDNTENIGVYYTRTDDSNPTLDQRVQLANRSDADLFISVHNNATIKNNFSRSNGTEVLYSESDTSELSSEMFAEICLNNETAILGSKNMGLVAGDRIYIIRTSEVPVALIEVGYMTNRDELKKLATEEYQLLAAQGIYNAIMEAFEKGY